MMRRVRKIIGSQKGMTLVELLLGMAVSGALLPATLSGMVNVFTATESSRSLIVASQNIEYAASRIKEDINRAQTTDLVDGAEMVDSLTLTWVEGEGAAGESHSVSYYLSGGQLQRNDDGAISTVGQYISSIGFSLSNGVLRVKITSSPGVNSRGSQALTYHFALK